ncbi:hypothetical protein [Halonotius terrestris]|uniref:hypothetical protein n=1 Tax=Halonotius terrestris TaxID=2487750 RepID=UPI00163C7AB2|nr:hypothetical protein [Halonotius terrestris]
MSVDKRRVDDVSAGQRTETARESPASLPIRLLNRIKAHGDRWAARYIEQRVSARTGE